MALFSRTLPRLGIAEMSSRTNDPGHAQIERILQKREPLSLEEFAVLTSPSADPFLETMARQAQALSLRHFGRVIRLFAPLYLSNECVNICKYCGFSRNNPIPRITIPVEQVIEETNKLARQGFRSLLLVAGEHPKYVSNGYVETCIRECLSIMPSIALELGPMETPEYRPLVEAGAEALVVYQETYNEAVYRELHTAGPKKHYHWRMDTPERAHEAGFRRIGIGALFGLHNWREEAIALAAHGRHLLQKCWKAQITVSLPRLRPAAGSFQPAPAHTLPDRDLVRLILALRLFLPPLGIVLSTREPARLRDNLIPLGITHMSAGSSTEPGGYSHFDESSWAGPDDQPGEQFHIADERSPAQVASIITRRGYEPVWKDFDRSLATAAS